MADASIGILKQLEDMATAAQERLPALMSDIASSKMHARQQHNIDRMEAQVDANLKKCNRDYVAPVLEEDDMSVLNNGVFIGDETITKIINALPHSFI